MNIRWITAIFLSVTVIVTFVPGLVFAQDNAQSQTTVEEKLYNFDDMLIDGAFRDPQGMFERARAEARFESVLNLERSFVDRMESSAQETSMRP